MEKWGKNPSPGDILKREGVEYAKGVEHTL